MRYRVAWNELTAIEPTLAEVKQHAAALAVAYNHPRNAPLLGHTNELSVADVIEHYERLWAKAARPFMLFENTAFAGDGDLRGIAHGAAEFAFLIAAPEAQGKGLGTRFATMVHALAFSQGIERVFAAVIPENAASRRVFEKLGYVEDRSPEAAHYGDEGDIILVLEKATFLANRPIAKIEIARR